MFLVIGAAGKHAGAVTRALARKGAPVRAFVRNEEKAAVARKYGATEVALGDLRDIRTIEAAAQGVSGIFHIGPGFMPEEASVGIAVIEVARRAGIRKFVYSGVIHPVASRMLNHDAKRRVEEHLLETDLEYTVLQPTHFMQMLALAWPGIIGRGVFAEAWSSDTKMSFVDYEDVAEVAAKALMQPGYERGTFQLCSPDLLTRHEQAAILSDVLGRPIRAEAIPIEELWTRNPAMVHPYMREGFTRMCRFYDEHGLVGGNPLILRTLLGREPTTFRQFVERMAREMGATGAERA